MSISRRAFLRAAAAAPSLGLAAQTAKPPNIILILADDLGYGDLGVYGNKSIRTPHLDRLAREGLRFTDFHANGPMCSPTRAAILTGRYQHRFGRKFESALGEDSYDSGLPATATTIAQVLKERGYATAIYGKWHLGYRPPFLPTRYGFDDFRGLASGDGDHHSHIDRSGRKDWWHNERIEMEEGYTADLLTRHSIRFIEQNKHRPFFLYLPHLAIHFPWQGPRDKSGYRVEGKDYNDLSKLGQLESKDVSAKVKEMASPPLWINTDWPRIHWFSSLPTMEGISPIRVGIATFQATGRCAGRRRMFMKADIVCRRLRGGAAASGLECLTKSPCPLTCFPPLRNWPAPAAASDGANLNRVLLDGGKLAPRTLFWRMRDKKAVRQGDWKLVQLGKEPAELYNLKDDIGESKNLAASHPDDRSRLLGELARWETDVDHP
jgi:arylsulfatase A